MIVLKFGGTSLADAPHIRTVIDILRKTEDDRPVLVVSAHAGVTDLLDRLAHRALSEKAEIDDVRDIHLGILNDLGLPVELVDDLIEELASILTGIHLVCELTSRTRDYILSFGERLSSRIVAAAFRSLGIPARAIAAWDLGLVTDSAFGSARPQEECFSRIRRSLLKVKELPVVTGFIAKDRDGNITTLGRSGSDYTASLVGAAVGAREIQIWTDVNGVMTADPRIVPEARSLPRLSFNEMSELAYYGARVIHPATMVPAIRNHIPVRVLNTNSPKHPGTVILDEAAPHAPPISSIAYRRRQTLINVVSTRMLLQHGFMARLFEVFGRHEVVVDMISTSEVSVSITTDSGQRLEPVLAELAEFGEVTVEKDKAIICLVGDGIRTATDVVARIFTTTRKVGVTARMISMGATRINVSFLVAGDDVETAVRALHEEFFHA
jgi:aspartate kinase